MATKNIHDVSEPTGTFIKLDGEHYYRISGYHRMPPFLMSIPSDTDLWMFISSGGGLTAGRVNADGSLFPYETADKLHNAHHHTGPLTLFRIRRNGGMEIVWQPFSERSEGEFRIERNLYKNITGNRVIFEEINHDLGLSFRYRWSGCEEFGLVRTATLVNLGPDPVTIALIDGLRNVLPYGAPLALYQQSSSLVDAYKRTDCDPDTRLGIFSLTSKIIDRAEAAEELRANTVWCDGLRDFTVCLSIEAIAAFRRGESLTNESVLTGRRGNYLVSSSLDLEGGTRAKWHIVADVGRNHVQIAALRARLLEGGELDRVIEENLKNAGENLLRNVGSADGIQLTGHTETAAHHFANVLFNNMRGGVFSNNYWISTSDLIDFLKTRNTAVAARQEAFLKSLPTEISNADLFLAAERTGNTDLQRLSHEYLPLYFGRRHGDPSRPWNRFNIRVSNPDGTRALHYEGNWRDIFQNWEALSMSFPDFIPNIIAKFVNASTVDGFNPYRVTRDGVDWEIVDPDDPWSYIGYWGDHQIIYLLKFLEALQHFSPGLLEKLLVWDIFCYTDVPYRIKPYEKILENPKATIIYDSELASRIELRVKNIGTDGKLLPGPDGSVYHVALLEKLLVPILSKLSNLVPDGGIWMNTQRPEWNDANNALAGNGISMVTLCYLHRYLHFMERLLEGMGETAVPVSNEVIEWLRWIHTILTNNRHLLEAEILDDQVRGRLLNALGEAFSEYREKVYSHGFSGKNELAAAEIAGLCRNALEYIDHAIHANRREDGLYHSYNLIEISKDRKEISVRHLYEMLEGQVAVLSSGALEAAEAVQLLSNLFESRMYREDQRSFMLYPQRILPGFLERNTVPENKVQAVPLLRALNEAGENSILERDALGTYRFHGDFKNALDLSKALDSLAEKEQWKTQVNQDREAVLGLFEIVFEHMSFTGRSGTMYGYEGLGCIYWHMVSKLLLAVQEITLQAYSKKQSEPVFEALAKAYYRIRAGLGFEKTVAEYGAFPTDPYSHTPPHAGAQQPGMTGQVKEEILTRFGELGVHVEDGILRFRPVLLRRLEFLKKKGTYRFYDIAGNLQSIRVPAGSLAFSFCQVPIIYTISKNESWIRVTTDDGATSEQAGDQLDAGTSRRIFRRLGGISRIDVGVPHTID